jgi:hypothetical protein
MKTNHTPGPWIRSCFGFNVLTSDSKQSIAAVHAIHPGRSNEKDAAEHLANAMLIAAAPDMLTALKAILIVAYANLCPFAVALQLTTCDCNYHQAMRCVEVAIAEAEGQS